MLAPSSVTPFLEVATGAPVVVFGRLSPAWLRTSSARRGTMPPRRGRPEVDDIVQLDRLERYKKLISRQETPNSVCVRSISRKSRHLDALGSREVMVNMREGGREGGRE